jgi:hypothetical protein
MSYLAPRFWLPHTQPLRLDQVGFLPDPENPYGHAANPQARSLGALKDIGCLVLLGEPGLGKSTALRRERSDLLTGARDGGELILDVDLGATGQEEILRSKIFGSEVFQSWSQSDGTLHLQLDSLDEARLRIEVIADLLLEGLQAADVARLRLQIACRSADRHHRLEEHLAELFGPEAFAIFELLPLRAADVTAFAQDAGVDADSFIAEVVARNLVSLASRPLTLRFLLGAARQGGGLPDSVTDLYLRGCNLLVEEPDEDRRSGSTAGTLSVSERVAIASRIAGAVMFSGRSGVLLDASTLPSADDVALDDLVGGREITDTAASDTFAANEPAVRETLGTGLFSARGNGRMGFAHQTFAEFLAARYLAARMSKEQVLDLLTLRESGARRVIPQLREVATWLATLSPELFDELLPADPDVLLRGDLALANDEQRMVLVRALLLAAESETLNRWDRRIRGNLQALAHPTIADQVAGVLFDPAAALAARELSAELAGACRLQGLADQMATLALEEDAPLPLRQATVRALEDRWPPPEVLERLIPLALDPPACDSSDELRGTALSALWPKVLSAEQLFDSLKRPQNQTLLGFYRMFLRTEVMKGLADTDLPTAARWATTLPREHSPTDALSELAQQILIRAWERREDPAVFTELVSLIKSFLAGGFNLLDHQEAQRGVALADRDGRHALIAALIPSIADGSLAPRLVVLSTPRLLDRDDIDWLVNELCAAQAGPLEAGWARLLEQMLGFDIPVALVMEAREFSSVLRGLTAYRFDPVRLDSPQADAERQNFQQWQSWQQQRSEEPDDAPDMTARIHEDLNRIEDGELDAFWHLNLDLSVEPGQKHYTRHFQSDLTKFPGWEAADETVHERIVNAAERYLLAGDPVPDQWFGQSKLNHAAAAGYRALRLLAEHHPERLAALGAEVWSRWSPIIVSWPSDALEDSEMNKRLVAICFSITPSETREWFLRCLDAEIAQGGHAFSVRRLRKGDLSKVEEPLLERVANDNLPRAARVEMLAGLLEHGSAPARKQAERLVDASRLRRDTEHRALATDIARLLIEYAPDAGWPVVWPLVKADGDFGRAVFEALASGSERSVVSRLEEAELAELFSWLEAQYPHAEDPPLKDGFVSARDQISRWRDQVLMGLAHAGTEEAVVQLDRLQESFPHLEWLNRLRREAQELLRRSRWMPPEPADVVRLAADASRRWVTDDAKLREVLVASLLRANEELQSATPAAADLWDTSARRPKQENELSDWLKRHLEKDLRGRGITVGREVQIRPGPGGKMGESGDLVVEAFADERVEGADVVSVTIEVKGCWHPKVNEAMRSQLAERYLLPEGQRQGIYLVGWFASDDWDTDDWRRTPCARRGLQESREFFIDQARQVSAQPAIDIEAVVLDCSLPPRKGPARRS